MLFRLLFLGFTWNILSVGAAFAVDRDAFRPDFGFPVACDMGIDCLIVNYVDQGEGSKIADYECNNKTYDGHKGVDIAVPSRQEMKQGVDVLAARSGRVIRVRDGEEDTRKTEDEFLAIKQASKECGNGILVAHEQGWQSFYCHLKKGSIRVKAGDTVTQGQPLAEIGQSGYSEFPHLHFSIIKNNLYIDPFTGLNQQTGCGHTHDDMWQDDALASMPYSPFAVFDGGFNTESPNFDAIKEGDFKRITRIDRSSPALVHWMGLYHAWKGDEITMVIYTPSKEIFHVRRIVIENSKKRPSYYFAGRKTHNFPLVEGIYTAVTTIKRKDASGKVVFTDSRTDKLIVE